ncbi:putative amino acid permease [Aspergillus clavatus NRRL 1]|uniref:Amino acid permease, putative n=1 Tax=Aspergillus clavatus (strain ATCC 1007 / CBS 513.65 / DSM 816 / NCTC 3887 / NRRL 1 / QM 1276 / 107) TaxID=344612 RepID=A1CQJ7_ASPCL|nr:amino acid permease, putative [Aspergillus clavatus NRRL 1]EAW07918.1 amino acid permease, putative [Aspergillus clavatus NRRL 1]
MVIEADHKPHDSSHSALSSEDVATEAGSIQGGDALGRLGYKQELRRNRSVLTLLFQTLAIAAIPYGEGGPLMNAIYGGGPLSIFVGWIVVCILDECIALSLAELASRWPTSAGPYYWSFQLSRNAKTVLSFINGWVWLIGNWTITLSVNFGFASLVSATISMYHPGWAATDWQLLLIFYAVCLGSFCICAFANRYLPQVDIVCATFTVLTIIVSLVALSVQADAGRHSAAYALGHYDKSLSGWGGFTFFVGLLPAAYTFSAIGMVSSMAEECANPEIHVPRAISLCVPVGGFAGLFFILPICFTLPPLEDILNAPAAQALPYIYHRVMGSPGGGLGLTALVLAITLFCSISITVAASRATWAFARDDAIPLASLWARVDPRLGVPLYSLALLTFIQLLLGLINLGSTSAFTAFVSVGVIALAVAYAIPIFLSLMHGRSEVVKAPWNCGPVVGPLVNVVALAWIAFELVLFSLPTALPVTRGSMNYASVLLVGFLVLAAAWYAVYARKCTCPSSQGFVLWSDANPLQLKGTKDHLGLTVYEAWCPRVNDLEAYL